jgi:succinate dehydrogenase/fumarate reductase-like Fe-S protein
VPCETAVPGGGAPVHIAPLAGLPVLRDLVTDTTPFFAQWAAITPYFVPRGDSASLAPGRLTVDAPFPIDIDLTGLDA